MRDVWFKCNRYRRLTRPLAVVLATMAVAAPAEAATPSFADFDKRAKNGEQFSIVFFGSSLTWGANASDPQLTSYRALISQRLRKAYPKAHFTFWDASLGGSGSQLAAFRLERDVLQRKPDLVFIEFSANDGLTNATPESLAAYEALVRRTILEGKAPVVQVVLPFQVHLVNGKLDGLKRRKEHQAIAEAYRCAVGDAVAHVHDALTKGKAKLRELWPFDRVYPDDPGYALFADAVWNGLQQAIQRGQVCTAPEKLLHADTYMKTTRFPLTKLPALPEGWHKGTPRRNAASFDMLMSRWLDEVAVASNRKTVVGNDGKKAIVEQQVGNLQVQFRGATVLLFGESTENSAKYRIYLDGQLLERDGAGKEKVKEFDASSLAYLVRGNTHLVHVVADGLDPKATHTLVIEPVFSKMIDQELRLESICVAGGEAKVLGADKK